MSNAPEITLQYDSIGKNYLEVQQTVDNPSNHWGRARVREYIGDLQDKVVIDGGCGGGHDSIEFIKRGAASVLAFDPSQVMLDDARERATASGIGSITFKHGTFDAIPFPDACCDVVIGIFSLHYAVDLDAAYREINRVLKPGGKIAFICTHPEDTNGLKTSSYKGLEVVAVKIYSDNVTVLQPSHTLGEYLSPFFLKTFTLDNLDEFFPTSEDGRELKNPVLFVFSATKK